MSIVPGLFLGRRLSEKTLLKPTSFNMVRTNKFFLNIDQKQNVSKKVIIKENSLFGKNDTIKRLNCISKEKFDDFMKTNIQFKNINKRNISFEFLKFHFNGVKRINSHTNIGKLSLGSPLKYLRRNSQNFNDNVISKPLNTHLSIKTLSLNLKSSTRLLPNSRNQNLEDKLMIFNIKVDSLKLNSSTLEPTNRKIRFKTKFKRLRITNNFYWKSNRKDNII